MKLTYTNILNAHFRGIGRPADTTDTTLLADFQYSLGTRYQTIYGALSSYINQDTQTASTVASQQYYSYPVGTVTTDSLTITIGNATYTLTPIYDQEMWNYFNFLQVQPTSFPQFYFPRKDDFGIWPIPQGIYTINFQRFFRDRNLLVDDYTTGTVTATNGSATVTATNSVWTDAMQGRWFSITDTATRGRGYWYRVASVQTTTSLTLETYYAGPTATPASYVIGECPELPEEAHILLPAGTAADYYSGLRNDPKNALRFDNQFWTGSYTSPLRDFHSKNVTGGLIGLIQSYEDRDKDNIIRRQPRTYPASYKIFSESIT